jgi:hypothetical protein
MDLTLSLFTLLHVLVLVYWLGGDIGAFYASTILTDRSRPAAVRAMAGAMLANLDMAPRSALILSIPTGVSLVALNRWWPVEPWIVGAAWATCLAWLALVWWVHLKHVPPGHIMRTADLVVRWLALAKLVLLGTGILEVFGQLPVFLELKLLILAGAIGCGLAIRAILAPFAALASGAPTGDSDAVIARCLALARPIVLLLWGLLLAAAWLGIAQPV